MAAYAALLSLINTINQIEQHPCPPILLDKKQVESLTEKNIFFQDFLEAYNFHESSQELESLRSRIADAAYAAEDLIENCIVDQIRGEKGINSSRDITRIKLYEGLQKVIQNMDHIKKELVEIQDKMGNQDQLCKNSLIAESLKSRSMGQKSTIVGFDDVLIEVMDKLTGGQSNRQIIPIVGMGGIGSSDVSVVRESFSRLVNARFIERCPAPEPFLAPPAEGETPAKKRKSAKLAPEPTTEQRVLTAAAPMESMRFLMEMDDPSEEKDDQSTNRVNPGKRKQDVLKFDEDANKEVLWRVNFEELVHRLRRKACVSYVKTKHNNEAGIVLSAMLELSTRSAYPINEIYDEVIKKEDGLGMDLDRIRASLVDLGCEALSTEMDEIYSLDINSIIEMAREEEVESVVLRRYGLEAYRIFRLLTKAGRLVESDKIAGSVFVEKKDTTNILYKLWKAEFVHLEKVRTSAAKQALFLLWGVNKDFLRGKVVVEMYHAALNLRLRVTHELDQGKEVLQLPREKLVGDLKKKLELLGNVRVILESSLMNLDDAILLFNDF